MHLAYLRPMLVCALLCLAHPFMGRAGAAQGGQPSQLSPPVDQSARTDTGSAPASSQPEPNAHNHAPPNPNDGNATATAQSSTPSPKEPEPDYWIDPDRPHIADSSVNVPKGLWLQENGFQQAFPNKRSSLFDFPETLIRVGVTNRTEIRYDAPLFITQSEAIDNTSRQRFTGFQNMQAGFKSRLGPLGPTKFQIAINPFIAIPSGFGGSNSGRVEPAIKFPFSQEINEHWDIEGMQSFFLPSIDNRRDLDWQNSFVLNRSWGRQTNAFIEYVGDIFQYGPMSNIIHFGAAHRPNRRTQVDVQFGFRMSKPAPIAFFGFGYSFLLGNLNTPRLTPSRFEKP